MPITKVSRRGGENLDVESSSTSSAETRLEAFVSAPSAPPVEKASLSYLLEDENDGHLSAL